MGEEFLTTSASSFALPLPPHRTLNAFLAAMVPPLPSAPVAPTKKGQFKGVVTVVVVVKKVGWLYILDDKKAKEVARA